MKHWIIDVIFATALIGWSFYSFHDIFDDTLTLEEFRWRRDVYEQILFFWMLKFLHEKYIADKFGEFN